VLAALPPTDLLVAAGPGWEGSVLPGGVERIDDLPGAIRMIREELGPG
jgi:hypothetical protein